MKVRHRARIAALQALYEIDCTSHAPAVVVEQRLAEVQLPETGRDFARELVLGVWRNRERLDVLIARYAPEWPVDQIAVIHRDL